jgi:hypothetical protein
MSQENVEIGEHQVERFFAAFNKRDWAAFSEELDPEVEYTPVEEDATHHGPEAVIRYVGQWLEVWATFTVEAEEIQNTPKEDHAFCRLTLPGHGPGERRRDRRSHVLGDRTTRRQAFSDQRVHHPRRSPRSRGPVRVGDVAGPHFAGTARRSERHSQRRIGPAMRSCGDPVVERSPSALISHRATAVRQRPDACAPRARVEEGSHVIPPGRRGLLAPGRPSSSRRGPGAGEVARASAADASPLRSCLILLPVFRAPNDAYIP